LLQSLQRPRGLLLIGHAVSASRRAFRSNHGCSSYRGLGLH